MRVVVIGPVYPYRGGIAHYTTLLVRLLAQQHTVLVISFKRQYPAWLYPGRSDRDPSQTPLRVEAEYLLDPLDPLTWWQTGRRIVQWKPDLVVIQWWVTFWAPVIAVVSNLCKRVRLPLLFVVHNVLPHESRWWDRLITKLALQRGDYFIVHALHERDRLLSLLPQASVTVCAMPAFSISAGPVPPRSDSRKQLALPSDAPVLLFFGLVREYKGLRYLLEAMPAVRAVLPDVRLLIAGEFWEDKRPYLMQIERLEIAPSVLMVDRYISNEDLPAYFSAADVLVVPYIHVSQSAVVSLAFAFGMPVITTRIGGLPKLVVEGETGLLVDPGNAPDLAHAIIRYFTVTGLAQRLRENIQRRPRTEAEISLHRAVEAFGTKSQHARTS